MRKIIASLAIALSIGAAMPAFAKSAVGPNPNGSAISAAEAGAGGR